jgi:HPt (histidine-containing phosphotransfer) domain-containing protein
LNIINQLAVTIDKGVLMSILGKVVGFFKSESNNINDVPNENKVSVHSDVIESVKSSAEMIDEERLDQLDKMLVSEMIELFKEDISSALQTLEVAVNAKDPYAIKEAAHYIKGGALNLGAIELAEISKVMQDCGDENNLEKIDSLLSQFKASIDGTIDALHNYMDK